MVGGRKKFCHERAPAGGETTDEVEGGHDGFVIGLSFSQGTSIGNGKDGGRFDDYVGLIVSILDEGTELVEASPSLVKGSPARNPSGRELSGTRMKTFPKMENGRNLTSKEDRVFLAVPTSMSVWFGAPILPFQRRRR